MSHSISQRVQALGLSLPTPSQPIANYVNYVISQNQLFISGQIPLLDGKPTYIGRLGESISEDEGAKAAELAALGLLAQLSDALGDDLSRLVRIIRLGVFSPAAVISSARVQSPMALRTCWSTPSATKAGMPVRPWASPACRAA